jgi:hypothetical protein
MGRRICPQTTPKENEKKKMEKESKMMKKKKVNMKKHAHVVQAVREERQVKKRQALRAPCILSLTLEMPKE